MERSFEKHAGHLKAQQDKKALEGEGYTAHKLSQLVNKPLLVTTRAMFPQSSCCVRNLPDYIYYILDCGIIWVLSDMSQSVQN